MCVDQCPEGSIVVVKDREIEGFDILRYCRSKVLIIHAIVELEIFIDPESVSYIELGT